MELDLDIRQRLATLLTRPERVTPEDVNMLTSLVKSYPYYQPLHLLLAKATNNLTTAALYNNGSLLHQIITEPKTLIPSEDINIITYKDRDIKGFGFSIAAANLSDNELIAYQNHSNADEFAAKQESVNSQNVVEPTYSEEKIETQTSAIVDEQETFEEINEVDVSTLENGKELVADEQEIFEEIAEVDAHKIETPETSEENITDEQEVFEEIAEIDRSISFNDEKSETKDVIESIVSADFFAFEKSFKTEPTKVDNVNELKPLEPEEYNQQAEAESTVSKYDDDKLPFTFLWWLAKTRKDHEQIFQPYVTQKKRANAQELHQQYVEHIFHIQTPFNETLDTSVSRPASKENEIIENFIKAEPQIKAPNPSQINNENKAKKSAEDNYDLVSETLASIYIEQMLYHKAIDTYEKLSLKFPEKSRYFADLIQSLEKKI